MITTVMNKVYVKFTMPNEDEKTIPLTNHYDGTPYLITLEETKNVSLEDILSDIGVINISVLQDLTKCGANISEKTMNEMSNIQYPIKFPENKLKEIIDDERSFQHSYISALSLLKLDNADISWFVVPVIVELKSISDRSEITTTTISSYKKYFNKIKKVVYGNTLTVTDTKTQVYFYGGIKSKVQQYKIVQNNTCNFPVNGMLLSCQTKLIKTHNRKTTNDKNCPVFLEYPKDAELFDTFTSVFKDGSVRTFHLYTYLEELKSMFEVKESVDMYTVERIIGNCIE